MRFNWKYNLFATRGAANRMLAYLFIIVNVIVSTHIRAVCFPIAEQCLLDAMKRVYIIREQKKAREEKIK